MMPNNGAYRKGGYGELIAEGYLRGKGAEILGKRVRTPYGEIDIVARFNGTETSIIVFAEVKLRRSMKAGLAAESVTPAKRRRIILSAEWYIAQKNLDSGLFRFDVLEVCGREFYYVNHIENAFFAEE